jgi:putative two-component system protein, hydrogenase maturation factor HypX/HoxX
MNILFFTSAHNSLSRRLLIELTDRGHEASVALATSDEALLNAVALYQCPFGGKS